MPRPDKNQNRIEFLQRSLDERVALVTGSPEPTLHRLERQRWTKPKWKLTKSPRRAMAYQVTALGTKQLGNSHQRWIQMGRALSTVMDWEVRA